MNFCKMTPFTSIMIVSLKAAIFYNKIFKTQGLSDDQSIGEKGILCVALHANFPWPFLATHFKLELRSNEAYFVSF